MTAKELTCRLRRSGHSRFVTFMTPRGDEFFLLPIDRLEPSVVRKLENDEVRCAVEAQQPDGTGRITMRSREGELLFQSVVWIASAIWELLV